MTVNTLRKGLHEASGLEGESDESDQSRPVEHILQKFYDKHEALAGIPGPVIRKAWFTLAHLLLKPGATVADMGTNPMMTYAMAVLNPHINFVGVDLDKKLIKKAQKDYTRSNLEFRHGDIATSGGFDSNTLDAVINSFILHEIYSSQKLSERCVINALEHHVKLLKPEGQMFIRDFAMPPPEEYVLLEMPEQDISGDTFEDMSEIDLLMWYAAHARPHRDDNGCEGFFMEELPQRFPQTRLFRLPYKWAYEFIMRKDDRKNWARELYKEYAFFTQREYRKHLRALGARVLYTAPQWDDAVIKERFEGRFRLYGDDGKPLGSPATSFIAVAQKMGEKESLRVHERRPAHNVKSRINISAMRNETNGELFDIISRDFDQTEILPYRVTEHNELNVYIHDGVPRGIVNSVPRAGKQIDGKRWSGHMIEALAVPTEKILETEQGEPKQTVLFSRDYLGLKPAMGCVLEQGPSFYPAPDYIDEQIKTRYLRVTEHEGRIPPRQIANDIEGFTTRGYIREVSAQSLLNAIHVGYIPNMRLEAQILALYDLLGLDAETWEECPLALPESIPGKLLDCKKFVSELAGEDKRFKEVKGTAGQLRTIQSIFVEEGWVEGGIEGVASRDIEFVITDDETVNKAVIVPLTRHAESNEIMAGMISEFLPIPQRHKGNGLSLRAPSFILPKEVMNVDDAKKFIAQQFDTTPNRVARMGESYFCHIGLTPVRIFPFVIATTGDASGPAGGPVQFAPLMELYTIMDILDDMNYDRYFLGKIRNTYENLDQSSEIAHQWVRRPDTHYRAFTSQIDPAVKNAAPVTAAPVQTSKPAEPPPSGLAQSGWCVKKAREQAEANASRTQNSFSSSPDFVDIHHGNFADGYIASVDGKTTKDPNRDMSNDTRQNKQKSKQ